MWGMPSTIPIRTFCRWVVAGLVLCAAVHAQNFSTLRFDLAATGLDAPVSIADVEVELTVRDTQSGQVNTYLNPLGRPFDLIRDTAAFATCPGGP